MNTKKRALGFLITTMVILLTACSLPKPPGAPAETTATPPLADLRAIVNATGIVVPKQEALLSVSVGGVIEDLHVQEGDAVSAGQVLMRLEGSEQQLAAISAAELALANAQFALETLYKDTDLIAAKALQSAETAERALEDLNNRELQQALAEKAVADAQKAVETTERNARYTKSPSSQADIEAQKAQVIIAKDALDKAQEDYKPYAQRNEDNLERANYRARLAEAQQIYDAAARQLNSLEGTGSEVDINVAEADYLSAQATLIQAERDLERVMDGPNAGEVALLEAQIEKGHRDFETYSAGPDPDDIALAKTQIANAENQLVAAKAALADLVLAAPFDGVVSAVFPNPNEWVAPGTPVLQIADLDHIQVETTDLGEMDVAQIMIGDTAVVTFDALPDLAIEGTVVSIAPKAAAGSGVNFPVILELSEIPPDLRWGMTAFLDIDVK